MGYVMDFSNEIALVQSKTFWAALLSLVSIVAQQFGASALLQWAADPSTVNNILTLVGVLGALGAMVGRMMATKPVTSVLPTSKTN